MVPLFFVYGALMLFPSCFAWAGRLSNVCGSMGACACVFVDSFTLFLGWVGFVAATEYVLKFCGRCEGGIDPGF